MFAPGFLTGWNVGRAAMLARWGCYLGWITEGEATGILWNLSQRAVAELHSWREFAQSYLFGGLMWKLLCGDADTESYLGFLSYAVTDLLTGKAEEAECQWKDCPWPADRKIGFPGYAGIGRKVNTMFNLASLETNELNFLVSDSEAGGILAELHLK